MQHWAKERLGEKPVSRKFIELSSLEILFFAGSLLHTLLLLFFVCGIFVWENTPV